MLWIIPHHFESMVVPATRLPSWLCHIDNYKNSFEHLPFLSFLTLFFLSSTPFSVFYFLFPLSLLSFFFLFSLSLPSSSPFSSLHSGLFTLLIILHFSSIITAQIHPRSSLPAHRPIYVFSLSSFLSLFQLSSLPQIILGKIIMAVNLSDSVILTVLLL